MLGALEVTNLIKNVFSHDILNVCVLRTRAPIEGDSEPPRTPRTQRPTRAGDMSGTLEVILVLLIPQTVACKLWVLALNLYIRFWVADFAPRRPPRSCHKSLRIFKFSKYAIQHVAVAPAKV